jgi:ribose 5-phosphate isomerase B
MRVAIACDHAGFDLKELLVDYVSSLEHIVVDFGTLDTKSVDYPDMAALVANSVSSQKTDRGILICGSGVGTCIAANKVRGIRACVCHDIYSAHQGVEHDDMNVLCLGARVIGSELAKDLVSKFLSTNFSNDERHLRRLSKVLALEAR